MAGIADQWVRNARQWNLVGPPLRPSSEDLQMVEGVIDRWTGEHPAESLRAALLGVTPELATMRWPPDTALVAMDRSEPMIRAVWPATGLPARAAVIHADWRAMPIARGAFNLVAGDGSINCLAYPHDCRVVAAAVRQMLDAGGLFVLRAFVRPVERESVAAVAADLVSGRIPNFHVFKWRLHMAVQASTEAGIRLTDTWEVWNAIRPDPTALSALGFKETILGTIEAYRGSATAFTFPTLEELRAVLAKDFVEISCRMPAYDLGDRCPTFVLRPK